MSTEVNNPDNLPVPIRPRKKPGRPRLETMEMKRAFAKYFAMGDIRSLDLLSRQTGISFKTVMAWSRKWDWQKRVAAEQSLLERGGVVDTPENNVARKKLVLDLADYLIKNAAIIDEKTGEVVGSKIGIKNVFDLRAIIDIRDEQIGGKDRGKPSPQQTTNIDKAVFIIKK